ncbi:MAG: phosphate signaling complex protein PhoU [Streptococcaceae bacterium]|jgi:phosphate transport system protein|nr:phosphate signaling complex protein PhoU [Streptococcaceae bacterium]
MLRTQFEEELNKLHNQFYSMGTDVSAQLNKAIRAFTTRDVDLAEEVIEGDKEINKQEVELETKSFELIALQQPVSGDLRTIITVLKASSDLERMGDHVASIAGDVLKIGEDAESLNIEGDINTLGEKVKRIVDSALNAYVQEDAERAELIAKMDDEIDQMVTEIQDKALKAMEENPELVILGKEYLMTLMHLERVGDFAKNLCEWVIYLKHGELVEF